MIKLLLVVCAISGSAAADAPRTAQLDVELNAGLPLFGGIGGNVGFKPAASRQVRCHAGAFVLSLPQFGLDENKDMGWSVLDTAGLIGARYYAREERGGLFGGVMALYQRRRFEKTDQPGSSSVGQYILAAEGGYEWFPSKRLGLYLAPNIVFAVRVAETGEPMLGTARFAEKSYLFLPGLNAGWEL